LIYEPRAGAFAQVLGTMKFAHTLILTMKNEVFKSFNEKWIIFLKAIFNCCHNRILFEEDDNIPTKPTEHIIAPEKEKVLKKNLGE